MKNLYKFHFKFEFIALIFFLLQITLLVKSQFIYSLSDAYVYQSFAKSLKEFGAIIDITTANPAPAATSQFGVVYFVYLPLFFLGVGVRDSIYIAQFLFIGILLVSGWQLFEVAKKITNEDYAKKIVILFYSSTPVFYYYASPINDGIYLVCILSLINLIISQKIFSFWFICKVFTFILIGSMCRNQMILSGFAISLFYFFQKQYRKSFLFITISILVILITFIPIYFFSESLLGVHGSTIQVLDKFRDYSVFWRALTEYVCAVIGPLYFGFGLLAKSQSILIMLVEALLAFFTLYIFIQGINYGGWVRLISLIALGSHLSLLLSPVIIDRYVYFTIFILFLVGYALNQKIFIHLISAAIFINIVVLIYRIFFLFPLVQVQPESGAFLACLKAGDFKVYSTNPRFSYFDLDGIPSIEYSHHNFIRDIKSNPNNTFLVFKGPDLPADNNIAEGGLLVARYKLLRITRREVSGVVPYYYYLYPGKNSTVDKCLQALD